MLINIKKQLIIILVKITLSFIPLKNIGIYSIRLLKPANPLLFLKNTLIIIKTLGEKIFTGTGVFILLRIKMERLTE